MEDAPGADNVAVAVPVENPQRTHVRTYQSAKHFAVDAPVMAAAGWHPVAQVETTGGMSAAVIVWAVIILIAGLFFWPAWILILFVLVAGRRKELVVTYRNDLPVAT